MFVRYIDTKPYVKSTFSSSCMPIIPTDHETYTIGKQTFAQPIQAAFSFSKVAFLQVNDTLHACSSDFARCKELTQLKGDVVCGNKQ